MTTMNSILVSVDYHDYLEHTLDYNRHHFEEVMVVTTFEDQKTIDLAHKYNCWAYRTNAFYRDGAAFNKYAGMNEGLQRLAANKSFWLCVMDADILLPEKIDWTFLETMRLYTPLRRMMPGFHNHVPPEHLWWQFPIHPQQKEWAGYCHIFHTQGKIPQYPDNWKHAGGADSEFQARWDTYHKFRPSWTCLHLGENRKNWGGRVTTFLDGTCPENSADRYGVLMEMLNARGNDPSDVFKAEMI